MPAPTKVMIYSNPIDGREKDYNDWYNNVHIPEVIAYAGVTGAQRFKVGAPSGEAPSQYVAIYDVEAGVDALALFGKLAEDAGKGLMTMTDAMAPGMTMHILEPNCAYQKG